MRLVSTVQAGQPGRLVIIKLKAKYMAVLYQLGKSLSSASIKSHLWSVQRRFPLSTAPLWQGRSNQNTDFPEKNTRHWPHGHTRCDCCVISWSCQQDYYISMGCQMLAFYEISYQPIVVIHLIWRSFLSDHSYMKYNLHVSVSKLFFTQVINDSKS